MAMFFVGQMVKKVRGIDTGNTGRIFDFPEPGAAGVEWEKPGMCLDGRISSPGEICNAWLHSLEPVLPTGHQPAELTVEELLPFLKTREVSDVAV